MKNWLTWINRYRAGLWQTSFITRADQMRMEKALRNEGERPQLEQPSPVDDFENLCYNGSRLDGCVSLHKHNTAAGYTNVLIKHKCHYVKIHFKILTILNNKKKIFHTVPLIFMRMFLFWLKFHFSFSLQNVMQIYPTWSLISQSTSVIKVIIFCVQK